MSVAKKLFLHIGTHKTATTSTQHFFHENRSKLRNVGIFYPPQEIGFPVATRLLMPNQYAHHQIAHAIADKSSVLEQEGAVNFFKRVATKTGSDEIAFVSAEPFYRHQVSEGSLSVDDAYEKYVEKVGVATSHMDTKILILLRRQDLFAESLFREHVLGSNYRKPFRKFLDDKHHMLDYNARISTWAKVFGEENIMIKPFERKYYPNGIEKMFVEWLGGTWNDTLEIGKRLNDGSNKSLVEYKRRINARNQSSAENSKIRKALRYIQAQPFAKKFVERETKYLGIEARHNLMAKFEDGNKAIADKYWNENPLFEAIDPSLADTYAKGPALLDGEFEEITRHMIKYILRH